MRLETKTRSLPVVASTCESQRTAKDPRRDYWRTSRTRAKGANVQNIYVYNDLESKRRDEVLHLFSSPIVHAQKGGVRAGRRIRVSRLVSGGTRCSRRFFDPWPLVVGFWGGVSFKKFRVHSRLSRKRWIANVGTPSRNSLYRTGIYPCICYIYICILLARRRELFEIVEALPLSLHCHQSAAKSVQTICFEFSTRRCNDVLSIQRYILSM